MTSHTPTPWHIDPYGAHDTGNILIKQIPGPVICEIEPFEEAQENADFIVRACNSHDGLIHVLERAEALLENWEKGNINSFVQSLAEAIESVEAPSTPAE